MDLGQAMPGRDEADAAKARSRAMRIWPVSVGFAVGCGLGAACEAAIGAVEHAANLDGGRPS
jgi:hypothetical protein